MNADGTGRLRVAAVGAGPETLSPPENVVVTEDTEESDLVVGVGESALLACADQGTPVLPVDAGGGVRSVARESLSAALSSVAAGEGREWSIPRFSVSADGERLADAVFDVMLVTAEPAHISEFSVRTPTDRVAQFRADGVLVATAPGTSGYARRVESPVFDPETPAAAVVPVAAFAIDSGHWVVPVEEGAPVAEVTVERDGAAVTLLADDREVGPVTPNEPLSVSVTGTVPLLAVPEGESPYGRPDAELRGGE